MKEMHADRVGHHQRAVPCRGHRIGMIMRRQPDAAHHIAVERRRRDPRRPRHPGGRSRPRHRAVTGIAELAAGRAVRSLIDHPAHRRRKGGVAHAVEDHLSHRALAVVAFRRGLVIDRGRQAIERSRLVERAGAVHRKRRGRAHGAVNVGAQIGIGRDGQVGQRGGAGRARRRRGVGVVNVKQRRAGEMILALIADRRRRRALGV